ncbi:MAG: NAD(P)/FAD-dependent oxidoreductase [Gemmatimonadales bacterium]|nr:MAG: NAD(P)/FAD-dependent oxidoreductase [Gemmatimonadales bacterium]
MTLGAIPPRQDSAITILGAGPAGLAAAITLARAGRRVVVLERGRDCGTRFRGDLQGIENWSGELDALEEFRSIGIEADFFFRPFYGAVHTNGRKMVNHHFERPAFYLVKRGTAPDSLDQSLKRQALAAGVTIRFRESAPPRTAHIVATGPDTKRVFAVDKGIVFQTDAEDLAAVLTHDAAGIKGYSYLLVASGYGCLCTVLFDRFEQARLCLDHARRLLTDRYRLEMRNPRPVGGLGHFAPRPRWSLGPALVAGEAAGLQDLLWGFGIRTAIRSGRLAGQAILRGGDWRAFYRKHAASAFHKWTKAGVVNRFLWEFLRAGDYGLLLEILHRGGLPLLRSFYSYNALQRLLYPVAVLAFRRRYPRLCA